MQLWHELAVLLRLLTRVRSAHHARLIVLLLLRSMNSLSLFSDLKFGSIIIVHVVELLLLLLAHIAYCIVELGLRQVLIDHHAGCALGNFIARNLALSNLDLVHLPVNHHF